MIRSVPNWSCGGDILRKWHHPIWASIRLPRSAEKKGAGVPTGGRGAVYGQSESTTAGPLAGEKVSHLSWEWSWSMSQNRAGGFNNVYLRNHRSRRHYGKFWGRLGCFLSVWATTDVISCLPPSICKRNMQLAISTNVPLHDEQRGSGTCTCE